MKKIFKKLFLTSVLTFSPVFILSSCGDNGDNIVDEEKFSILTNYDNQKGTVKLDKASGMIGEKVNATITPNEGYTIVEVKFNEMTLTAASSLELTPVKGENILSVTFESFTTVEKSLVLSGTYKTEYKVGEALNFDNLEVKLFTTTNGVKDEGVIYNDYKTSVEEGHVFTEEEITNLDETFDVVIYSDEENVTSTILELTIKSAKVEAVGVTPSEFLRKMKETERYTVENDEMRGVYIPNAHYWTVKESGGSSSGFAQDGKRIICYGIVGDRYVEYASYDQVNEQIGYNGMYDQKFADYLVDLQSFYFCRGIGYITDKEIANYEATLKPKTDNPNVYDIKIPNQIDSYYCRDLIQLTYNGTLALTDSGLKITMGYNASIRLTMLSKTSMKIEVVNGTSARYWPISTIITLDETTDIPQIQPFLKGEEQVNPDLEKGKRAFDLLRNGNFTTSLNDIFSPKYVYRKETNEAQFSRNTEFNYSGTSYAAGNYKVSFNSDNTVQSLSPIEIGGYSNFRDNGMLHKDELYLTSWNGETNSLTLTYYADYDTQDYLTSIPNLYCNLFNIDMNTTEENVKFRNIEFVVHFTDKDCTIIDCINVKFGRPEGNKLISLTNFGTSKADHVETFINSLK